MFLTYDIFEANFYIIRKQQYQLPKTRVIDILKVMNRLSRKGIFRMMFENCAQSESIYVSNCYFPWRDIRNEIQFKIIYI